MDGKCAGAESGQQACLAGSPQGRWFSFASAQGRPGTLSPPPLPKRPRSPTRAAMSGVRDRAAPWWRAESRATIALAYPLVLTNFTQALIPASLGVNLFNACMIFGVGVMIAASPMMARALGQRAHNVRDVRRTVRQTMWAAVVLVIPIWLLLWHAEAI